MRTPGLASFAGNDELLATLGAQGSQHIAGTAPNDDAVRLSYSHSIVPGGLLVTS